MERKISDDVIEEAIDLIVSTIRHDGDAKVLIYNLVTSAYDTGYKEATQVIVGDSDDIDTE